MHSVSSLIPRILLGSALLTLLLLSHQSSFGQARVIATYNSQENNDSPLWKRQDRLPHSPYTGPGSGGQLQPGSATVRRKRSLYPNLQDEIAQERESNIVVYDVEHKEDKSESALESGSSEHEHENQGQTLIEPRFPSIELFDEVDVEMFELGEDGFLHEMHRPRTDEDDDDDDQDPEAYGERYDQVWMVDEWEEDLEGDMDELMDWADDDSLPALALNKKLAGATVMGSQRLHDQGSMIQNALLDEDETSPFERLIADSWLF
ncbi:hypothetical protein B0O80DRAFT_276354 [Mortierella sp. GBAus27b]|nr:hypothetical protein BGX31_007617 [Mortierella sp. GBA43]KAI8358212.1 hypothetical protein B0O80DRAFT_276354 [Mortierella sp. GBAus27b]